MKITRETSLILNRWLDQLLPPFLRDSWSFMWLPLRLVLGQHARTFSDFKGKAFSMSTREFSAVYAQVGEVSSLQGETDLNRKCERAILAALIPCATVLEVGSGRGYLARKMALTNEVVACDIAVSETFRDGSRLRVVAASAERLPFTDGAFDIVVCTHTLEHVQDIQQALRELRRVARRKIVIVVPKQRPYRHTFSLHIHFFPYAWSLEAVFGGKRGALIRDLDDWYYEEELDVMSASKALA